MYVPTGCMGAGRHTDDPDDTQAGYNSQPQNFSATRRPQDVASQNRECAGEGQRLLHVPS